MHDRAAAPWCSPAFAAKPKKIHATIFTSHAGDAARKARKKLSKLQGIAAQVGNSESGVVVDVEVLEASQPEEASQPDKQSAAERKAAHLSASTAGSGGSGKGVCDSSNAGWMRQPYTPCSSDLPMQAMACPALQFP